MNVVSHLSQSIIFIDRKQKEAKSPGRAQGNCIVRKPFDPFVDLKKEKKRRVPFKVMTL